MKLFTFIAIFSLMVSATACTPSALQLTQLNPVRGPNVFTLRDAMNRDTSLVAKAPANADKVLLIGGDSVIATFSLYELDDIFWLDIYLYNGTSSPYFLDAENIVLMDASRLFFRRLEPHEAANIYISRISSIPPYQPKYTYDVRTATSGYLSSSGYYSGYSNTTVTQKEDPYNALGYSIGAAIAGSRNKKYVNMASTLYSTGLVKGASIPSTTIGYGGVFWLKRAEYPKPLRLRLSASRYEVEFALPEH